MSHNETPNNEKENKLSEEIKAEAEEIAEEVLSEEYAPDYPAIIEDLNDKLLRTAAEMQNIRRRAELDVQKAKQFSVESFAKDLLSVMDNLYRASESISDEEAAINEKLKTFKDGIEITKKELLNVFERNHIKRVDPNGEKFDPNLHQALSQIDDGNAESGTIINVMQAGYILRDRVLRPALVVVAK